MVSPLTPANSDRPSSSAMRPSPPCISSATGLRKTKTIAPNDLVSSIPSKKNRESTETCVTLECSDALSVESTTGQEPPITETDATTEMPIPSSTSLSRAVSFDTVQIREYSRALGDNPATTHGPPLTLDWDYVEAGTIKVDDYEETRPPRRKPKQMAIPGKVRESILLEETQTTKKEIRRMTSQVSASRSRRQTSIVLLELEDWQVAAEFVIRRLRRLRRGVTKEREQEMLWEQAEEILGRKRAQEMDRRESKELDSSGSTRESDSSSDSLDEEIVCSVE